MSRTFMSVLLVLCVAAAAAAQDTPRGVSPNPALSSLAWLAGGRWSVGAIFLLESEQYFSLK